MGWLEELAKDYLQADQPDRALEVYLSRDRYAEAAAVLEDLGRLEEALDFLGQSGAANCGIRGQYTDGCPASQRAEAWSEEVGQLKGIIAARQKLGSKRKEPPVGPGLDELERMFALGEITKEEFERKKRGLIKCNS